MATNLQDSTVVLSIRIGVPGNRRTVSSAQVEVNADKTAIRVSKELVKSPERDEVIALDTDLKRWLFSNSLPSRLLKPGMHRLPVATIEAFETYIEEYRVKRGEIIDRFIESYPALVETARETLRDLFDVTDYPPAEDMRRYFGCEYAYLTLDTPSALANVSKELLAREREKAIEAARLEVTEIQQAMRQELADILDHAVERLGMETDGTRRGKPRTFRNTLITGMADFFATFEGRNVVGDEELAGLVASAREIMNGTTPDRLRRDSTARAVVKSSLEAVRGIMDANTMLKPTRKISFEDEV